MIQKVNMRYILENVLKNHPNALKDYDVIAEIADPRGFVFCTKDIEDAKEKEKTVFEFADKYENNGLVYSVEFNPDEIPLRITDVYGNIQKKVMMFLLKKEDCATINLEEKGE